MERDIVDRLRAMAGPIVPNVCTEAADEIERLWADRTKPFVRFLAAHMDLLGRFEAVRNERDEARRLVCNMKAQSVTNERDEARRWVCNMKAQRVTYVRPAEHFAREHGWDCFKEDSK